MKTSGILALIFAVALPATSWGMKVNKKTPNISAIDGTYTDRPFPAIRVLSDPENTTSPVVLAIVTTTGLRTADGRPPAPSPVTNIESVTYYPSENESPIAKYSMMDLMKFQVSDPPSSGVQKQTLRLPIETQLLKAVMNDHLKEVIVVFRDKDQKTINVQTVRAADIKATNAHAKSPSPKSQESVGVASMDEKGVIRLQLRSIDHGMIAEALKIVRPGDADYESTIQHLGGLKIGESKPIPPFPSK